MTVPILGLAGLQRELAAGRTLPPVENWNPAHCGEIDIRIVRDGTWFHEGRPIARRKIVRLFSTILRTERDGYYLVTPVEKMRITVEDAPFLAVLLDVRGSERDQQLVRRSLEARISRNVYYQLADLAVPDESAEADMLGVWSSGVFFPLGAVA